MMNKKRMHVEAEDLLLFALPQHLTTSCTKPPLNSHHSSTTTKPSLRTRRTSTSAKDHMDDCSTVGFMSHVPNAREISSRPSSTAEWFRSAEGRSGRRIKTVRSAVVGGNWPFGGERRGRRISSWAVAALKHAHGSHRYSLENDYICLQQ